jgi:predicted DNA-binding protein
MRLGAFGLPAELAERLNVVAQALGVSAAEVVRRAVYVSSARRPRTGAG